MNRHFILASHGTFAQGVVNSIDIILGEQTNLYPLCAYVNENEDLTSSVNALLAQFSEHDELIVITDLFGGSVNNEFMKHLSNPNLHLIAGLNLPLMIQLIINQQQTNTVDLISEAITNVKEAIQYCNHTVANCLIPDKDF